MIKTSEMILLDLRFKVLSLLSIFDTVSSTDVGLVHTTSDVQIIRIVQTLESLNPVDQADRYIIDNQLGDDEPLSFYNECLCRRILIKQPRTQEGII